MVHKDDDFEYEAVRRKGGREQRRVAPLVFDLFYPLLLAVILVIAATYFGVIDARDLNIRAPAEYIARTWFRF